MGRRKWASYFVRRIENVSGVELFLFNYVWITINYVKWDYICSFSHLMAFI